MPNFTPAQRAAIDYAGENLLLCAAAGSGKTATLTERIVSLLTDPREAREISRMLVVTYTKAAASELKERIGKALRAAIAHDPQNTHLTRQLIDLGRAQIGTIHAFCLSALRPYFSELSLPATFQVAEEAQMRALQKQVMTDTVSAFFEAGEADFLLLADTLFGPKNEESLDVCLLALANKLSSHGMDGDDLVRMAGEMAACDGFFSSPLGAGTRATVLRFARHYADAFFSLTETLSQEASYKDKYLPSLLLDQETATRLREAADTGDYEACRRLVGGYAPLSLKAVRAADKLPVGDVAKELHAAFKKDMKTLGERSFSLPEDVLLAAARKTAAVSAAAGRVLSAYFAELSAEKRERGLVDFSDLEFLTHRLLYDETGAPSAAALEIGQRYDFIFIDEFQDTNRIQDRIFSAIAQNARRFMVGDIKQSIYGFRGAEPEVFAAYRRTWPALGRADGPNASHFMQENFRCDKTVVDFVNLVSRYLFSKSALPFTREDELKFAKISPPDYTPRPVEVVLCRNKENKNAEAEYVAKRVEEFLRTGVSPSEIAILLRAPKKDGAVFETALKARGIPTQVEKKSSLYENPSVLYALSILRAMDNPGRDIDLAAAMRGPVFGFTLSDIIEIRRQAKNGSLWDAVRVTAGLLPPDAEDVPAPTPDLAARTAAFVARLTALRAASRGMEADALLNRVYAETDLIELCCADPDGLGAATALRTLYDMARSFACTGGGGLSAFLTRMESAAESAGTDTAEGSVEAVRVISIHHAKGLEFPICFLCNADKSFNRMDTKAPVLFDPLLGAVMRLTDESGLVRCDTPLYESLAATVKDAATDEEMRILYVALTRARERLVVTAAVPDPEAALDALAEPERARFLSPYSVFQKEQSFLAWILSAVSHARFTGEDTSFVTLSAHTQAAAEALTPPAQAASSLSPEAVASARDTILENLSFVYPHAHLAALPAKLSVSRLYPAVLDGTEDGEMQKMTERNAPPSFLSGKTENEAAFAGTATHAFLQFADFPRLREGGVASERDRLLAQGFLSPEMGEALRMDELCAFVNSAVFARMLAAPTLYREFRFNDALPAAAFTEDEALRALLSRDGAYITVQGVMDALFIDTDGRAVLLDYKTDRLTPAELRAPELAAEKLLARHARQLSYYRAVAARMLGRPVDETLLYSLPLGDTVAVPDFPLAIEG